MKIMYAIYYLLIAGAASCSKANNNNSQVHPVPTPDTTFMNPLLNSGPDPWVIQQDTNYYYTNTMGNHIAIYKTGKMSQLGNSIPVTIWTPPVSGAYSKDIWAPELHLLQNKWYVYFGADNGIDSNHRIYVLENASTDPLSGSWVFKGEITDSSDKWEIDPSVFEYNNQLYFLWSGWKDGPNVAQNIYIAKMKDPWTIDGNRVMISTPDFSWEKAGAPPAVNEGPEILKNSNGKVYLVYSASGCWTDNYSLGMLSLSDGGDPMIPSNWTKSTLPVFTTKADNGAFSPGHNAFFKSRDGKEDWIIYHANPLAGQGCRDQRSPRMQKFSWNADGSPYFGEPVKINSPIKKPSGE